ncbi:MAG TPA: dehydrogenase [Cyanobacteria bacterium UBA11162]|nr:dehydrogenase [Cyanobacteria bacterium UBA11162]
MIIRTKAPLRLGLGGGGTDVEPYCSLHGGYVLNATIDLYAYCTIEQIKEEKVVFVATDRGEIETESLQFPLKYNGILDLHKAVYNRLIEEFNQSKPLTLKVTTFSDAPAGSGLGSSSTLVVAMIKAYAEMLKLPLGEYDIAYLAYQIERLDLGLVGGKQDQYAATFGGFNFIEFYEKDRVIVNPLRIKNWIINELELSLILCYTGISRSSALVIENQVQNIKDKNEQAIQATHQLRKEALLLKESLLKADFFKIFEIFQTSWEAKKKLSSLITNSQIDKLYQVARDAGAYSGKITGAGGGGFIMFMVNPAKKVEIVNALTEQGGQVINFHFTKYGTQAWTV